MSEKEQIKFKFCHTADWHLDYYQYQKKERWEDFIKSANECSKLMIDEKPDFIVHCGDFFHNFKPSAGAIRFAIRILRKFKEAKIPFYVIRGNHDASKAQAQRFGGTILKFLDELGFLHYIDDESIGVNDQINITGIGEYGKTTGQRLEEVLRNNPLDKSKFNILLLHGYLQGQVSDSIFDISGYQLAGMGFNYIALGHYHKKWIEEENNIYCPGSTEQTSLNDWGKPDKDGFFKNSGYFSVNATKENKWESKVKWKKFKVRPKGRFTFEFKSDTPIDILKQKANDFIQKNDLEGAIIRFDFIGELPLGKQSLINFNKLEALSKTKALHIKINQQISKTDLGKSKISLTSDKALLDILEKSYNIDKKNSGHWLDIIEETVKILGAKTISSENAEEIKTIYDLITEASSQIKKPKTEKQINKTTKKKPAISKKSNKPTTQSNLGSYINEGEK